MEKEKGKVIQMNVPDGRAMLLQQLEELTDPKSVHFIKEVFEDKEKIREDILNGKITLE
jgi:hypothetical protein